MTFGQTCKPLVPCFAPHVWVKATSDAAQVLVGSRHAYQQCAGSAVRRLQEEQSQGDSTFAQTLRRSQQTAKVGSVPVRNVDARLLHQPCRQVTFRNTTTPFRSSQRRASGAVWPRMKCFRLPPDVPPTNPGPSPEPIPPEIPDQPPYEPEAPSSPQEPPISEPWT